MGSVCGVSRVKEVVQDTQSVSLAFLYIGKQENLEEFYTVGEKIGSGTFGVIRKATRLNRPQQVVAVKTIDKAKIQNAQQMTIELEILMGIDHPNIIKFHDCFSNSTHLHLVMEYCEGGELFERILQQRSFSEEVASHYMENILRAVSHLHSLKVCHRDLKPQNFLFESEDPQAQLKLIDFGLSNRFCGNRAMNSFVGSPYYIAPEVIQGSYDMACDLWSCGVIMYIMLSGELPFGGMTEAEVFMNIIHGNIDICKGNWRNISSEGKDLISLLLLRDPVRRITATEALKHPWITSKNPTQAIDSKIIAQMAEFKHCSRMKSIAMDVLVRNLSDHELQELQQAFLNLDKSHTGYLSIEEVTQALLDHGIPMSPAKVKRLFVSLDFKKNGQLNYSEFIASTLVSKVAIDEAMVQNAFRVLDIDNSGYITKDNLLKTLLKLGNTALANQIDEIIREVDLEKNGMISFEEFQHLLQVAG